MSARGGGGFDIIELFPLKMLVPDEEPLPMICWLYYRASDPYAVILRFINPDDGDPATKRQVDWIFARELLRDGLLAKAGEDGSDVRVWPVTEDGIECIIIALSSPDGVAQLRAESEDVRVVLDRTVVVVPEGHESAFVDRDALAAYLLTGSDPMPR